jgi:rhodanese-related sulfurtransferase
MLRSVVYFISTLFLITAAGAGAADPVEIKITENLPYLDVPHDGKTVRIQRIQDEENVLTGGFAKTSRKCPPFCVHSMLVAPGVTTVGELELLDFIQQRVTPGTGLLIDARAPEWYAKGTIPGSVNIPFFLFQKDGSDPEMKVVLDQIGIKSRTPGVIERLWVSIKRLFGMQVNENALNWDLTKAKDLLLWCNGPWCDQSPRAIHALIKLGYPESKLSYYRGGMQDWQVLGLTVVVPGTEPAAPAPAAK